MVARESSLPWSGNTWEMSGKLSDGLYYGCLFRLQMVGIDIVEPPTDFANVK